MQNRTRTLREVWLYAFGAMILAAILVLLAAGSAHSATPVTAEAETMKVSAIKGETFSDPRASANKGLILWRNASTYKTLTAPKVDRIIVRARGDVCKKAPQMVVKVNGVKRLSKSVNTRSWTNYTANVSIPGGRHNLAISFNNDYRSKSCDRNLRIDKVSLVSEPISSPAPQHVNPFAGEKFYVDPNSSAARQAAEWRATRPEDARQMDKIAAQPATYYFSEWTEQTPEGTAGQVDYRVSLIQRAGALPVIGAYAIPKRDCGSYSGGGASSPEAYKNWIRSFANGIGDRKAVVILEPDALAGMDCLSAADKQVRLDLLRDAVNVLKSKSGVYVYVDAGNPNWHSGTEMASRLKSAGIERADGFSLNISNFIYLRDNIAYGKGISSRIGGKHFIVDTSRNGGGPAPDYNWCNPPGRALGPRPTSNTGESLVDAFYWMKWPGESDGECGGNPPAGTWMPEYALGLAQRAAY